LAPTAERVIATPCRHDHVPTATLLIAKVKAGNGYSADGHEFLITPWNTPLILAYTTATANLTSIGGPASQTVIDGIVQEIDIKTGKVPARSS